MGSPVLILFVLAAVAGITSLEVRRARVSVLAIGAAFGFFALAMLVMGAAEVAIGAFVAGAVVMLVLSWGFRRTSVRDTLPALLPGVPGGFAAGSLIAFAVTAFFVARVFTGLSLVGAENPHISDHYGILRELVVVFTAAAAVWAMLRKTGRRDE